MFVGDYNVVSLILIVSQNVSFGYDIFYGLCILVQVFRMIVFQGVCW